MIEYKCSKCGATLQSPSSMCGQHEQCPECGAVTMVPRPPEDRPPLRTPPMPSPLPPQFPPNAPSFLTGGLPAAVCPAYAPSGKTEPGTWLRLLGFAGLGFGAGLVVMFVLGAIGGFTLRYLYKTVNDSSMLVKLAFLGGFLFYFVLGPLALPIGTATLIGKGAAKLKCRSPLITRFSALVVSALGLVCIWVVVPWYVGMIEPAGWNETTRLVLVVLYGMAVVIITVLCAGREIWKMKFCESCGTYMKEMPPAYYSLEEARPLLSALSTGDEAEVGRITKLETKSSGEPTAKNYLKLMRFECGCQSDPILEVEAHVGEKTQFAKPTFSDRLVFSKHVKVKRGLGRPL